MAIQNCSSIGLYISSEQQSHSLTRLTIGLAILPPLLDMSIPPPNARHPQKPSETFPAALPFTAGYKYQQCPHSTLSLTHTSARLSPF
jgi:hypothetical protein